MPTVRPAQRASTRTTDRPVSRAVSRPVGPASTAARRARRDRLVVIAIATTAVLAATVGVVVGAVRVSGSMQDRRARESMAKTFAAVYQQQGEFRRMNARFARWDEMAAAGVRLPPSQSVRQSSADASHWFLSLRDRNTGLVCDRSGELFDEADDRPERCRAPSLTGATRVSFAGETEGND